MAISLGKWWLASAWDTGISYFQTNIVKGSTAHPRTHQLGNSAFYGQFIEEIGCWEDRTIWYNLAKDIVKWKLRIVYSRMIVVSCTVLKKHPIFLLPKSISHLQHSEDHPMISGFSSDQQNLDGPWFVLYLPLPKNISSSVGMIIPMEK